MLRSQLFINSLFIFAWLSFLRCSCFWAYFWQLKEYRWLRVKEEVGRNQKVIPWRTTALSLLILAFAFGFPYLFHILAPIYFFIMGSYAIFKIIKGRWVLPQKFTAKIILIIGFSALGLGSLFLLPYTLWLKALLLASAFWPLFMAGIVNLVAIPVSVTKHFIVLRAQQKRDEFKNLIVIGITGSYGKTSVKEFLATLLEHHFGQDKILKTPKHINTKLGIAQLILKDLKNSHQFFVCEIGAYHRGEIKKVTQLVQPKIGILTGINEQHLALFGSLSNTIQAKTELIDALPKDGLAVFNGDNIYVKKVYQSTSIKEVYITTQLTDRLADLRAEDIKVFKDHLVFTMTDGKESIILTLPLIGRENIVNILLASLTAQKLGISLKEIQHCFQSTSFTFSKKLKHHREIDIINSAYSTNPSGFLADLNHLKLWVSQKIVVTPGVIELGSAAHDQHQKIGEKLSETADLVIFTKNYYLEDVQNGLAKGVTKRHAKTQLLYLPHSSSVIKKIRDFARPGDVILLEGRLPEEIIKSLEE